ncbi:MAG: hypothetical protein R3254_07295 [Thiomicrorhabdus sp.]|nr:hypothetical protein [Thiomicrorhabdus sp.]
MASRPVFIPSKDFPFVKEVLVEFKWHAGFAVSQKQKSIVEFHEAIDALGLGKSSLEISSKSSLEIGTALSAFNLKVELGNGQNVAVENIFQAAKIFEQGGPFKDLLKTTPLEAKRDIRLKESGDMVGFRGKEGVWPLEPKTLFYDWIYINALHRQSELASAVLAFDSFTDIEFNPAKSFNCQARSVALYIALFNSGQLQSVLEDSNKYKQLMMQDAEGIIQKPVQKNLI